MASVKMSGELRNDILNNVADPYNRRKAELTSAVKNNILADPAQLKRDLIQWMCDESHVSVEFYESMPEGWLTTFESVTVDMLNGEPTNYFFGAYSPPGKIAVPANFGGRGYYNATFRVKGPQFDKYVEPIRRARQKIEEMDAECKKVLDSVRELLNKVTTLKAALDVYPALERWVPQYALDKLREPSQRKERAKAVREELDLSAITTALLRDRVDNLSV